MSKSALVGADLVRGAVAVSGDEPGGIVVGDEVPQPAAQLFDGVEGMHPQEVLLQGADRLVARIGGVDARSPTPARGHAMRTYSGRPRSSMRFSTSAAIATSVAWRPSLCDRSPSPMTRFHRAMSDCTRARQLYPDAFCQPMRPRSAMIRRCRSRRVGAVSAASLGTAPERGGTTTAAPAWCAA